MNPESLLAKIWTPELLKIIWHVLSYIVQDSCGDGVNILWVVRRKKLKNAATDKALRGLFFFKKRGDLLL